MAVWRRARLGQSGALLGNRELSSDDRQRRLAPEFFHPVRRRGAAVARHGAAPEPGLFLTPVTRDLALTAADFTLAIAVQNIVWGLSQAPVGALADRFGLRVTIMAGAAIYVVGLGLMAAAHGEAALSFPAP